MTRWLRRLAVAVRSLVRFRHADRELNEELDYHLDREIQEGLKAGLSPRDARIAAIRAMGAIEINKQECRDLRREHAVIRFIGRVAQDAKFAWRLFSKHPAPVGIAIGGLALAIGVVTAAFSIVNASLLRPYGMDDPSSVVRVSRSGHSALIGWPYTRYLRMRSSTAFQALEAGETTRVRFAVTPDDDGVANRRMQFVTGGYLQMLGGRSAIGRTLVASDDLPNAPPVIVVSHHFWRTQLDGDAGVVGRTVWINDAAATLVGVLRPGFTGPVETPPSIWATLAAFDDLRAGPEVTPMNGPTVDVVGWLAPGVSRRAAQDSVTAVVNDEGDAAAVRRALIYGAASPLDGPAEPDVLAGLAAVFSILTLVLALACANTANLLMASAWTRMREVGVRLAMGATRRRLTMQLVTESLLVGLAAGGVGVLLAFWLVPFFGSIVDLPPELDLAPDARVLVFATVLAVVCGLGAGLAPARHGARGHVLTALQAQSGSRGHSSMPVRFRASFVGFQAAVSMLLLVGAALVARAAWRMAGVEIGFDADRLVTVQLSLPRSDFDEPAYVVRAVAAVRALPDVERVSVSQTVPFGWTTWHDRFVHAGRSFEVNVMLADAELFATAGVRILRGRAFTPAEAADEAPVALISDSVARTFFGARDPLGQSLSRIPSEDGAYQRPATIVGIVAEALMTRVDGEQYGTIYRPLNRKRSNPPGLLIRTDRPGRTVRAVEDALRRIDARAQPAVAIARDGLDSYLEGKRRLAWLLAPAALLSLVLAALGVYGVTSFIASQRTEEVSVRLALGASSRDVLRLLVLDGLRPVVVGLSVGLGLALAFSRVVAADELSGISPFDPAAIGGALSILAAAAVVAVAVPARRAARTDPAALLRQS